MANTIGFGQAAVNNTIDYGQGAIDNTINWGKSQTLSPSGETNITGTGGTPPFSNLNSFSFDGIDDSFLVPDTSGLSFGNGTTDSPFSISFWVNLNSLSGNNNVFIGKDSGSPNREYAIGMFSNSNKVRFFIKDNGGNSQQSIDSTTNLTTSSWFHIVTTYSGVGGSNAADGMKIYINGSLETSTNIIKQSYTAMKNTSALLTIGKINSSPSQISGLIDETAIFTTELSSSDVSAIYNNGEPQSLDTYSPLINFRMGDNATWNGATWTMTSVGTDTRIARSINMVEANRTTDVPTASTFSNTQSILLDGVDDRVDITNSLTTLQGSYSAWIKPDLTNDRYFIVSSNNGYRTFVGIQSKTDGTVLAKLAISHQTRWTLQTDNSVLNSSNWTHVALVHNGTEPKLYIDGVAVAQSFGAFTPGWDRKQDWWAEMSPTPTVTKLGTLSIPSYSVSFWRGVIDEVSIFTTELSASDVSDIYGTGVPNDISSLSPLNWWRCGDGDTAPILTDNGSGGNDGTMTNFTTFSTDVPT